jgi:hypothetical protein
MDQRQKPNVDDPVSAEGDDRRPTPVRMVMEGMDPEGGEGGGRERALTDPETGLDWVVTVAGRAVSGVLPVRTIPLMELSFSRAGQSRAPERRAVCRGEDLPELTDTELLALLRRSEPYSDPLEPGEKHAGDRRRSGRHRHTSGG